MRKIVGYVLITVCLALAGLGAMMYIKGGDAPTPVWDGGEVRVGYSSEPPYAVRLADGSVSGEAPEIAKAVLTAMGVRRYRFVLLDFQKAIPALLDGQIDMIANGLFITPQRAAKVRFSLPFSLAKQGLLVRRGNPLQLHSYEDAALRPGVTVAVLDGSVEQQIFARLGVAPRRLFVVPEPVGGLTAVRTGRADCLALSRPSLSWLAGEAGDAVEVVGTFRDTAQDEPGQSAFAFRPADVKLAQAVDAALRAYIGSPEHLRVVVPFGFGVESLPQWRHPHD